MPQSPLLLPPSRAVVPRQSRRERYVLRAAVVAGIFAVLVGAADVSARLAGAWRGERALFDAFAPAAALDLRNAAQAPAGPARISIPALGIDAPAADAGHLPGIAALAAGDYVSVVSGGRAQVYEVVRVRHYPGGAPAEVVARVGADELVLTTPGAEVVVVAQPAYR